MQVITGAPYTYIDLTHTLTHTYTYVHAHTHTCIHVAKNYILKCHGDTTKGTCKAVPNTLKPSYPLPANSVLLHVSIMKPVAMAMAVRFWL